MGIKSFSLLALLSVIGSHGAVVKYTLVLEEWVVDFLRPTLDMKGYFPFETGAERKTPFKIEESQRSVKYLINGSYPGPTLHANEGNMLQITVINKLFSESTTIHWHGIHPLNQPYMDGARSVTQGPIMPGENFTYRFEAWPPGTHYYHSHMDAVQGARGVRGPLIIQRNNDPVKASFNYSEDLVVFMSDEWKDPSECLKLEGAMPGNDVCADIRHGSFNGMYGNGSHGYPFPLITVKPNTCYRMRFIMAGSNTENFQISIAGHNMTMVSIDGGTDVKPTQVTRFNLHLGERVDVIMCTNQEPGNYLIHAQYDYACALTPGHFIPPGFAVVPTCDFYAYLNYDGQDKYPADLTGTGGGKHPQTTTGVEFDLTRPEGWTVTEPLVPDEPEPEEPDVRYVINLGLLGPVYDNATAKPLQTGRWYMDTDDQNPPRSYELPSTPLYMTKGKCGTNGNLPVINVPENATTVEVIVQNLSPAAHVLHMHGMTFKVINVANFTSWCGLEHSTCFGLPWWAPPFALNQCPTPLRKPGDPNNKNIELGGYWGCVYDPATDKKTQNLQTPLVKDSFQLWQRSWAVIRFKADRPGYWYFHCHETQHLMLGLQTVFNILPSKQPPVPADVPTSNAHSCPTVNQGPWGS
jgi:FtsP/CotA-like multicopper oxidase with cupredoxin domain